MILADFYPKAVDLVKSELSVLNYLRNNPYINEIHPQVAQTAAACYLRFRDSRSGLEFNSHLDIWHAGVHQQRSMLSVGGRSGPNVRLTISAAIELGGKGMIENVSYCLSVCRFRRSQMTVLRKFHFDVTSEDNRARAGGLQQRPRCHLQYCGEMLPYMEKIGCRKIQLNQMYPWLSEPRILYWPMSLALLLDMALHEFPDQRSAKFRADSYWRGLIHSQEELILRPFCETCLSVIRGDKDERILADAFYTT
jgi:hypothetical protein